MIQKKANISIIIVVWLIVMLCCTALLSIILNSRYTANEHYSRQKNRYMATGSVDLCTGILSRYFNELSNDEYYQFYYGKESDLSAETSKTFTYLNTDEEGNVSSGTLNSGYMEHITNYRIVADNSPYIVKEMESCPETNLILDAVSSSVNEYLASIGYLDFRSKSNNATISFDMFNKSDYNLYTLIADAEGGEDWLTNENASTIVLPEITAHIDVTYMGGHISSDAILSGIAVERESLAWIDSGLGIVNAKLNTDNMQVALSNYKSIYVD